MRLLLELCFHASDKGVFPRHEKVPDRWEKDNHFDGLIFMIFKMSFA